MTPVESAIHAFVREHAEAETRFLAEIVKVSSDNPPGDCDRSAEVVATLLGRTRLRGRAPQGSGRARQGQRHDLGDQPDRAPPFGQGGPTIALNAHGDVVPPGAGWTHDPYGAEIVDGWMYRAGRGGVEVRHRHLRLRHAGAGKERRQAQRHGRTARHLRRRGRRRDRPALICREGLSRPDLAIGAGFSYAVVNAHNGCLHLEVEVLGRSAHAARPFTGVDALEAANAILSARSTAGAAGSRRGPRSSPASARHR